MDKEIKALIPVDEREVLFYDDALLAVLVPVVDQNEPQVYIPVKPLSDALGLSWSGQFERLQRDEVLSEMSKLIRVTRIKSQRGNPDAICLPIEFIPGWLFGITASRVKEEIREKIKLYRRECYKVLAEAFREGRLTADPSFDALIAADTPAVQTYKMMLAMTRLARNQVLMEARLSGRIDDHESRLEQIESTLGDSGRHVTPDQASQISQAVKAVAMILSKQSRSNQYGAVYGEMYRKFGITSYKQLPAGKFEACIQWLTEWHGTLTSESPF